MEKYNGSFSFYYISAYLQKDAFWRNEKKNLEFEIQSRKMLNYMSNGYSYASRKCNKAYESFVLGDGQQILSLSLSLFLSLSLSAEFPLKRTSTISLETTIVRNIQNLLDKKSISILWKKKYLNPVRI